MGARNQFEIVRVDELRGVMGGVGYMEEHVEWRSTSNRVHMEHVEWRTSKENSDGARHMENHVEWRSTSSGGYGNNQDGTTVTTLIHPTPSRHTTYRRGHVAAKQVASTARTQPPTVDILGVRPQ